MHGPMIASLLFLAGAAGSLAAQSFAAGSVELPPLLPREREIALARSAAPAAVSGDATVLVLERGGYVVAERGTSGVTCYVSRSWPQAIEPHCFDREGSDTILQIYLRRAELREEGMARAEIDAEIAASLLDGRLRLPARPAMSYMMSSAQVLYNDDGVLVGAWRPHLMLYTPYITNADVGLGGPASPQAVVVVDSGQAMANLMVVVEHFVDPMDDGGR